MMTSRTVKSLMYHLCIHLCLEISGSNLGWTVNASLVVGSYAMPHLHATRLAAHRTGTDGQFSKDGEGGCNSSTYTSTDADIIFQIDFGAPAKPCVYPQIVKSR